MLRLGFPSLLLFLLVSSSSPAEEAWPHWRGPSMDGVVSDAPGVPTTWSREENVLWRLELPGPAASTPVVWGDRLFLTSTVEDGEALRVLAVSRDGEVLWSDQPDAGTLEVFERFAIETSLASPSPTTDGERLYVLFGTGQLLAYDFGGKVLWRRDLTALHGAPSLYFGINASPLIHDGRLYLQWLHGDGQKVLAIDAASGEDVWVIERETDAEKECLHAYTTPIVFGEGEKASLVIHGADYTTAHRFADGAELWRHGGLNPKESYNPSFRLVATPVAAGELLVVPSAKRGPVYGLEPSGARGVVTGREKVVRWKLDRGTPDVPSPLVHDGLVYLSGENGRLTVLDAASGEQVYAERVHQSTHRASPVWVDGKILLTATDGTVSVVKAGRSYELLAKNELGERLAASPVVVGDRLYLRSYDALWAIGKKVKARKAPAEDAASGR